MRRLERKRTGRAIITAPFLERIDEVASTGVSGGVQDGYAGGGRPSIDPVVFFQLQLVAMRNEL